MGRQIIPGYCGQCVSRCGCRYIIEDGRLAGVEPDPAHPAGKSLCIKGRSAAEIVYSPERLLYPLKRSAPKGAPDPGWKRISWDEALGLAAQNLHRVAQEHGPESVAFTVTTRSGTSILDSFSWILRLCYSFGSPNAVLATENCNWHKDFTTALTFGSGIGMPDFEKTGCLLLWGFNPSTCWLSFATKAAEAKKGGARLIVVDPRRAGLAKMADEWLRLIPGSDGILAMGIAAVLLKNDWFDGEFVSKWTNGPFLVRDDNGRFLTEADIRIDGSASMLVAWDESANRPVVFDPSSNCYAAEALSPALSGKFIIETLAGAVTCQPAFTLYAGLCGQYLPEKVEELTGVPAAEIVKTARLLHENRPVSYFFWTGVCQQNAATQTTRAINLLYMLTGSLDSPGGNVYFSKPLINDVSGFDLLSKEQRAKTLGVAERPLGPPSKGWVAGRDLYRAILEEKPYAVKGLVGFGQNLLLTQPDAQASKKALQKLDFYVHCDLFLNQTANYADIILPVASPWEREGLCPGFQISAQADSFMQLRKPVVEPRGESRPDNWIVFELAKRLGLSKDFFNGDMEAGLKHVLKPSGVSPDELREKPEGIGLPLKTEYRKFEKNGFATPSRRVEVYSQRLLEAGLSPLPEFSPGKAGKDNLFPLILTSAKTAQFCHSQNRSIPGLRRSMPDPLVYINPKTAEERDIIEGGWVVVRSPHGCMRAKAAFDDGLLPEVVCSQYGWWRTSMAESIEGEANYSNLIGMEDCDRPSGSASLRSSVCEIEKWK